MSVLSPVVVKVSTLNRAGLSFVAGYIIVGGGSLVFGTRVFSDESVNDSSHMA